MYTLRFVFQDFSGFKYEKNKDYECDQDAYDAIREHLMEGEPVQIGSVTWPASTILRIVDLGVLSE
jgi:hypothetical protein